MVSDEEVYRGLVHKEGPFQQLLKSVKSALAGRGLERVFLTGVAPVALSDVSSGFNVARNVYRHPQLNALCGFSSAELRDILDRMVAEGSLPREKAPEALGLMRDWYDGYRFADGAEERVYNPTNCLYFLQDLQERGTYPENLLDHNLAADRGKLAFLGHLPAGSRVLTELMRGDGRLAVKRLEDRFTFEDLATRLGEDDRFLASLLYYLGMLTDAGKTPELDLMLEIPNLVVEKLYVDQLAELWLPASREQRTARERWVRTFLSSGELEPLLERLETELRPLLSNRDYLRMGEQALKMIFLTLFFDDRRHAIFSELETARGYADVCLLLRPEVRTKAPELADLLFELKFVPLAKLGKSGENLAKLENDQLRALPAVAAALGEARAQSRPATGERSRSASGPSCGCAVTRWSRLGWSGWWGRWSGSRGW
ncbi:MAG: AAA family ATPase [Thermoanaerobaculia bacterium]|nr:AAA family ATPase [Thermoanaerobaculia bacterium]